MRLSVFIVALVAVMAMPACTQDVSNVDFIRCWGGDLRDGAAQIRFRALLFPRNGVISSNPNCPQLRLKMEFEVENLPEGFRAFDMARENPFETIGMEGVADIVVESRDGPRMVVLVRRLVSGRVLSEEDARQVIPRN